MWHHSINVKVAEKVPEKQLFFTKNFPGTVAEFLLLVSA
jgi:hypothetical protein